jgi:hypothetical protein
LDRSEIILAYLKFDKKEELKDLQTKVSFVELVEHGFNDINGTQEFKEKSERVKKEYQRIKSEKDDDERKQSLIYRNYSAQIIFTKSNKVLDRVFVKFFQNPTSFRLSTEHCFIRPK